MTTRRPFTSLLLSIAIHAMVGVALVNVAFHYDFSLLRAPRPIAPPVEHLTYIAVHPGGGASTGSGTGVAARAITPQRALVAPRSVPTAVAPQPPAPTTGTAGGAVGGTGRGGGLGITTGVVVGERDPRLDAEPHEFFPVPKTRAQRVDSAVRAQIYAYNDSVAVSAANAGRKPGDWTFEKNGQKWGIDGNKIYLGKFAIPSAVLAALPIRIQGNPGEAIADRLSTTRRSDILVHADAAYHDDEFKSAIKRIRERKERERREAREGTTVAKVPEGGQ